jgi:archaellum component FlaC
MIVCSLCPFIGRYFQVSPFDIQSWFYYKTVYDFADRLDRVAFCGHEKNFQIPAELKIRKAPFFPTDPGQQSWGYKILDRKVYENTNRTFVPEKIMDELAEECGGSVFQAWRKVMSEPYPPLVKFYRNFLRTCAAREPLEFILAAADDVSMTAAAAELKVPFVRIEKGPLRQPDYLGTVYWNLSGVSGSAECEARLAAAAKQAWKGLELSREELLFLFCADQEKFDVRATVLPQDADAGVAGQEEDGSCISDSRSCTVSEAVQFAENLFPNGNVIIHQPPKARTLCAGLYDTDPSGCRFMQRVGLVICISSNAALEAVLLGKNAMILSESPFQCLSSRLLKDKTVSPDNLTAKLNFILLNYLVPVPLADSPEYTKWRLSKPSELEIRKRHLDEFLKIRGFKDLKEFRKTFREYQPKARQETAGELLRLEPDSVMRREKEYSLLAKQYEGLILQHSDLEKRHGAICEQHADLEKRHGMICSQHADLEKRHAGLYQQYKELVKRYDSLFGQYGELKQIYADLDRQFNDLKKNYNALCERHQDLEKRHGAICGQHADLEKRHAGLYQQYLGTTAALRDAQERFGWQSSLLNESNIQFNKLQADFQNELPQLREMLQQYSRQPSGRQGEQYFELWLRFISSKEELLKTLNQVRLTETKNNELSLKIQDLELQRKQFLARINFLSGQISALTETAAGTEKTQEKNIDELKQEKASLTNQLESMTIQLQLQQKKCSSLEQQLENLNGQYALLKQQCDMLTSEKQELHGQFETLQSQHSSLLQSYQLLADTHAPGNPEEQRLKLSEKNDPPESE